MNVGARKFRTGDGAERSPGRTWDEPPDEPRGAPGYGAMRKVIASTADASDRPSGIPASDGLAS
jgi:hypothetical protein